MKVKDLLSAIFEYKEKYPDIEEWEVFTEQLHEVDKKDKRKDWEHFTDSEDWEYFQCFGFHTLYPEKKRFTINVNY